MEYQEKKFIDISRAITPGALVYPGDPPIEMSALSRISGDCGCNVLRMNITTHILTHIDAPYHFLPNGRTIDEIPVDRFLCDALVVAIEEDEIQPWHLPLGEDIEGCALLFKTRQNFPNRIDVFDKNHSYLTEEAAKLLAHRQVNICGIDCLSIEKYGDEEHPAHKILLANGVLILEGLDLARAAPGRYTLAAFPLKIGQGDGSPVRAVLIA
jgi:arylformamidase